MKNRREIEDREILGKCTNVGGRKWRILDTVVAFFAVVLLSLNL